MRGVDQPTPPPGKTTVEGPPSLPPIGGQGGQQGSVWSPQLPPLSFSGSPPGPSGQVLSPITEQSSVQTHGQKVSTDTPSVLSSPQPPHNAPSPLPEEGSPPVPQQNGGITDRPLSMSPISMTPPTAFGGNMLNPVSVDGDQSGSRRSHDSGNGSGPARLVGHQKMDSTTPSAASQNKIRRVSEDGTTHSGFQPSNMTLPSSIPVSPTSGRSQSTLPPTPSLSQASHVNRPISPSSQVPTSPKLTGGYFEDSSNKYLTADHASALSSPPSGRTHLGVDSVGNRVSVSSILTSPYSPTEERAAARVSSPLALTPQDPLLLPPPVQPAPRLAQPPRPALSEESESHGFGAEAGALYYMQQFGPDSGNTANQPRRVPPTVSDNEDDSTSSSDSGLKSKSRTFLDAEGEQSPSQPVRQNTSVAFAGLASPRASSSNLAPGQPADRHGPASRQNLGRKPSGARAQATRSFNGEGVSSSQLQLTSTEEEETGEESMDDSRNQLGHENVNGNAASSARQTSEEGDLDVLAALSYLAVDDNQSAPVANATVEPLKVRISSPPPPSSPVGPDPSAPFKSSFAPSKQAAERKAKAQAQQAAHQAAVQKPGRANGKRKSRVADRGAWNESSEEEDDEEEDDDDDADSDAEPPSTNAKPGVLPSGSIPPAGPAPLNPYYGRPQAQAQGQALSPNEAYDGQQGNVYLRHPRTLPQIPGNRPHRA